MKTIIQLQKAARRIQRRANGSMKTLTSGKKLTAGLFAWHQSRVAMCAQAAIALKHTLRARNIGGEAVRCALPKRIQRIKGILPALA